MHASKRIATCLTTAALLLALVPGPALAAGAQLEGLVIGIDERPAAGHRVHLIDAAGTAIAQAPTDRRGTYSFSRLPAGEYSLGIENPSGGMAPVAGPVTELADNQLARRDITLMQSDREITAPVTQANYSLGLWWAGLTGSAKVWTIVGVVGLTAITAAALSDDDDDPPASDFLIPGR